MENNNIIQIADKTLIISGGNALPGCPNDWDEAKIIQEKLNKDKCDDEPAWRFDCGFKLDFDGPLVSISSRFYPPKTHYGATWDGSVSVYLMGKELSTKKFDCATLDELTSQVEKYVQTITKGINDGLNLISL